MSFQYLEPSWQAALADQWHCEYMQQLQAFLQQQARQQPIYPPAEERFNALNLTPLARVRVVILGQDPYHGPGQAHGLSFSVKAGVKIPPSLLNIYKELHQDVGFQPVDHGCLSHWAEQGVLLLNSVLTVQHAAPNSHQGKGWERFTDRIIQLLNDQREGIVFMLWGSYAQKKGAAIDARRHAVLRAPHPSPLSAYRGFFGSGHFSKANAYLQRRGERGIDWQLPRLAAEPQPRLFVDES